MLRMTDCVFCKIRDGQIPSAKVYEDTKTIAFMDINPLTRGHCLVATKQHAATIYDVDAEDLKAVMATAKKGGGDPQSAHARRSQFAPGQRRRGLPGRPPLSP